MKFTFFSSLIGKTVARISRLKGGHGSALPGLIVEKINPHFLRDLLSKLPRGAVVISGTNGKTTTTKMVVELLRAAGLKVFTNPSGSNFTRGVVSSALGEMHRGRLNADIAILELDEAHAVHFVREIKPRFCLLLNVLRDQLDRFGEIDTTAKMLETVAKNTTDGVVLNRDDPLIAKIAETLDKQKISYFGYSDKIAKLFPNDNELYGAKSGKSTRKALVILDDLRGETAIFNIGSCKLKLRGAHNALNAAAALSLTKVILGKDFQPEKALLALSKIKPAFGRGESFVLDGTPIELILVKNPSGFRISLASQNETRAAVMIAVNDQYADGRDMSWLWDVDFSTLEKVATISGVRAYDMALRLTTQQVKIGEIEPDLVTALKSFLANNPNQPKQIYATYTAMLQLRKLIKANPKTEKML